MTIKDKKEIANSFSKKFEKFQLDVKLTEEEFSLFNKSVLAGNDGKWYIFVLDNYLYWATGWSCIYKIQLSKEDGFVRLTEGFITREKLEYNSDNIENDRIEFLKLLQVYLERDDIYVDPALNFVLVKQILAKHQPCTRYKRSIGRQSVELNKIIYKSIQHFGEEFVNKTGWKDFYEKIKGMNDDDDILSLYIQEKGTDKGTTYHFDTDGKTLISIIVPAELSSR